MKIAMANDHAAVELKNEISEYLREKGHVIVDFGTDERVSCDYPVFAEAAARAIVKGEADCGVMFCGTGAGVALAANKVRGIRAVVCSEPYTAMLCKRHNNANVLTMGARVIGPDLAKMIADSFLDAEFEGGRHSTRVNMIMDIEARG